MFTKKKLNKKPAKIPKFLPGEVVVFTTQSTPERMRKIAEALELPRAILNGITGEARMMVTTVKLVVSNPEGGWMYIINGPEDMEMPVTEDRIENLHEALAR